MAVRQHWWTVALNDPWRDPDSPAVILAPAPVAPPPPPVPEPQRPLAFTTRTMIAVALIAGLLAGSLGGAIAYVAATATETPVVLGAGAGAPPAPRSPGSLADLVPQVMPSVVTVTAPTVQGESLGSGFVIAESGYVLTNEHVVSGASDTAVTVTMSDGTSMAAVVVGRDPESDLAVLKVSRSGLSPVFLGDSDGVVVGDGVFAIGTPLALPGTVTAGVVSALDRTIEARDVGGVHRYYAAIQTDAAVNRGSSGGPLFDYAGRVIGVNSVIKSVVEDGRAAGNIGIAFAIPINQAIRIASEIIDTGRARRTVVGANFAAQDGGSGVRITTVDDAGPAAAAGMQVGDVVLRLDGHNVEAPGDVIALVRRYQPGATVTIVYSRGGVTQSASVVLVADAN